MSFEKQIEKWFNTGVCGTTIHQALVEQFGFTGSYSSVRRLMHKLHKAKPEVSCMLDFAQAEAAKVDFGKGPAITDAYTGERIKTWIFVITLCFICL